MVYGDLVSFPFPHLCFPSSPHTPGIITPCGINTQLKFYFLLISFLLSLSHIHMLSSLCPLCLFVSPLVYSVSLATCCHDVLVTWIIFPVLCFTLLLFSLNLSFRISVIDKLSIVYTVNAQLSHYCLCAHSILQRTACLGVVWRLCGKQD